MGEPEDVRHFMSGEWRIDPDTYYEVTFRWLRADGGKFDEESRNEFRDGVILGTTGPDLYKVFPAEGGETWLTAR